MQKRGGSGVSNRWRASSNCQEEESEGKEAKEEEKTPTKSGGRQEEEDAEEGDKEDMERKDEVAVLVSGSES